MAQLEREGHLQKTKLWDAWYLDQQVQYKLSQQQSLLSLIQKEVNDQQ